MTRNLMYFHELEENVIAQLKEQNYMHSTIMVYQRIYRRFDEFMKEHGVTEYPEKTGKIFPNAIHVCPSKFKSYSCAIRRLNDCSAEIPYRCHYGNPFKDISETYTDLLDSYLEECIIKGNKPATTACKKKSCTLFLNYIEQIGCNTISKLDAEMIAKTLLIYDNKDKYAIIRMFLRYLSCKGYTSTDLSGIVPHYKRRSILPSVYTTYEILKIETDVDTTIDTGKRDLAIIKLSTRMGLRCGDIAKLRMNEIDFNSGYINIIQEKTGQPLSLQMPEEVSQAIEFHLQNWKLEIH